MKHLDFTIDFEICSLCANAAPMQVAIVPWQRDNDVDPFCKEDEIQPYVGYVDLRSCVVGGYEFDTSTLKWWSEQGAAAKKAVTGGFPEPIKDVLLNILDYISNIMELHQVDSICLWCQGEDIDIAILRNMCRKHGLDIEEAIPHTSFRDCRTVILEAAAIKDSDILVNPSKAYFLYEPLPERFGNKECAHDALYDAMRSSWTTWQALKWLHN